MPSRGQLFSVAVSKTQRLSDWAVKDARKIQPSCSCGVRDREFRLPHLPFNSFNVQSACLFRIHELNSSSRAFLVHSLSAGLPSTPFIFIIRHKILPSDHTTSPVRKELAKFRSMLHMAVQQAKNMGSLNGRDGTNLASGLFPSTAGVLSLLRNSSTSQSTMYLGGTSSQQSITCLTRHRQTTFPRKPDYPRQVGQTKPL